MRLAFAVVAVSVLCLGLLLGWLKPSTPPSLASDSSASTAHSHDTPPFPGTFAGELNEPVPVPQNLLEGPVDVSNRYSFTVSIETARTREEEAMLCSGLLIAPRLVLTAGHCVCAWHKADSGSAQDEALLDASLCASFSTITAMVYQPGQPGAPPRAIHDRRSGAVRPHPELRIVRDAHGKLTSVHANLALIVLDEPMQDLAPPPRLADSMARLDEFLFTVGNGNEDRAPHFHGQRRFNRSQVVGISEDHERIFLSPPPRRDYQHDSGGPCLRQSPEGDVLVGISNRGLGEEPCCVSTRFHEAWLKQEMRVGAHPQ